MVAVDFFAHSTEDTSQRDWQTLPDHSLAVAAMAERFAARFGAAKAARLAGLLHDLGKYSQEFQLYIQNRGPSPDHSTAGAWQVLQLAKGRDRAMADIVAYLIAGHHAGLPDRIGLGGSLNERLREFSGPGIDPAWQSDLPLDATDLTPKLDFGTAETAAFRLAFLGRMIFSCLVDADFKDTEAFYNRIENRVVDRDWPALQSLLPQFLASFESYMGGLPKVDGTVNVLRAEILGHVRSRASQRAGLFTLTVPTGGGKTLASLGFALDHAKAHGLDRIIFSIPFTSIIDQTADIFRKVLGASFVLEHHSAIEEEKTARGRPAEARDKLRLAMEDWAAPVIVTTNVQLFESLFAARTSRARKLHNIANSLIILDEAQTLPRYLLAPAVQVLDELARNYGCTIVLCTATQPALDKRNFPADHPMGLPLEGRELAPDPVRLAEALRRVTLTMAGAMDNEALLAALAGSPQGLVIVNSRKHALDLFRAARSEGLDGVVHLTTRQCAAHRREILAGIRGRLEDQLPCRVIATSLVEAGVDLDFPRVWRAEAGLESIMQAAGRCNREGRRLVAESLVTVFSAPDYPPPPDVESLSKDMMRTARKFPDLQSLAAMEDYFCEVYWRMGEGLDREKILADFKLDQTGTNFAYREVAHKFRMIESGMVPVIIPFNDGARQAIRDLAIEKIPSGALARKLQTYVVQVPPKARQLLIDNAQVRFANPDLRAEQFAVLTNEALYSGEIGLDWDDPGYFSLDNSIV